MSRDVVINFEATPVVGDFMASEAFFRIIMGPVGSGKTTGAIFEMLRRSMAQAPAPDGIRYTRWAIVRQTLKQLKDTVLKDIEQWLQGLGRYKVSDNTIYIEFGDVRSEWLLIPLEDPEDQRRLLSMQLTGAWMSEVIEMDPQVIPALSGRCGRYPSAADGGASWFGIIADTNFPTEGSEWHRLCELQVPPDWQIFKQPGGLSEGAENLNWLTQTPDTLKLPMNHPDRIAQGRTYYERLARGNSEDWVKRYVHAQYGNDPSGSAVFRESFKPAFHVAEEVQPVLGHPIIIGQDFGRNPCAVITQLDHRGRLLVLGEIISEDMGLELHIERHLRPQLMNDRYIGKPTYIVGDPAGRQRSTSYEETSFDLLKRSGLLAYPAPTNDIDKRLRAVEAFLFQQRDGGPALIIDKQRCPILIRALSGMYRYAKRRNTGQLAPLPEKTNPWSDIADALQYACLTAHGGYSNMIANRMNPAPRQERPRPTVRGWT